MTKLKNKSSAFYAAVDIGTQTFRLAVACLSKHGISLKKSKLVNVRLGEGLSENGGRIVNTAMARAEDALHDFSKTIEKFSPCQVYAVATAAMRQAPNAHRLLNLAERLAIPLEIIDWKKEAAFSWKGVNYALGRLAEPSLVVDIGGGSTEFLLAKGNKILYCNSFNKGAVNLTNKIKPSDPPTTKQKRILMKEAASLVLRVKEQLPLEPQKLVGVGGTATTLAAMDLKLDKYDPAKIRGYHLALQSLEKMWNDMNQETVMQRAMRPGLESHRADIILAGTALMIEIMMGLNKKEIVVSDGGLLLGILITMIEREYPEHVKSPNTHSLYL